MAEAQTYGEHRPYAEPPVRIEDLTGPVAGVSELPTSIDWGPHRTYDLSRDDDRRILYERVLREAATTAQVCYWVNAQVLVDVWPRLWLPERLRRSWEGSFPQLRPAITPDS